jgi:ABC-2 type transport system permease protein
MRILTLALKDLKQMLQSWQTAFFLLIMPVGFTLMFGFMFGGIGGDPEDPLLLLGVLDQDGTEYSQMLIDHLSASEVVRPIIQTDYSETTYRKEVEIGDLHGALILPAGLEESLLSGHPLPLTIIADDQAVTISQSLQNAVLTAYARLFGMLQTASLTRQAAVDLAGIDSGEGDEVFIAALTQAVDAWQSPPVTVSSTYTGTETDEQARAIEQNAFIHSSPGMMAQFAISGLIGAAEILVTERRSRVLSRMLTTGFSRIGILTGHFLAITSLIVMQLTVLVLFGQFFLELNYFASPLATTLMILAAAATNGALGLLIGALAKTSDRAIVFSLVPMFIFSGLGGAWTPLEFTSETVQFVGHFTPVAWMMDGFKDILARGAGLETVWLPVAVLLGFAAIFFTLGVWRFKFE